MAVYAIIRIRGRVNTPKEVEETLKLLRLVKKYHAVIYPSTLPGLKDMLNKAKDWITWGEVSQEVLIELLRKRGRIAGGEPLTDEFIEKRLGLRGGIEALSKAIMSGEVAYHKLKHVEKVFRLHPPKGGFKGSVKKPYNDGGELGYRNGDINNLLKRMI
ncbi:MAG: 50S ribosomal protein L30 [Desulfurococcaceae archaeon]